jgi:general L-amino acid transport system permease protein
MSPRTDDHGDGAVTLSSLTRAQDAPVANHPPRERRARIRAAAVQFLIFAAIVAVLGTFLWMVWVGLKNHGIGFNLRFLREQAGFDISEGITVGHGSHGLALVPFSAQMTNAQALVTGLYNTLVVGLISLVLSTGLGLLLGVVRMSKSWIGRNWAWALIELVRNTPLLIQILFWYFVVILRLPSIADASLLHGAVIASRQGIFLPWFVSTPGHLLALDFPVASTFSVSGGIGCSPEMASLIAALSVNTAAFIAEIVRGAVESINKGQWEAAAALGLGEGESLRVVVLPQALRVILPSLGNQYISLIKSTSFAIAIGFPDLFNVYGTVANQSGRSLEGILIVMFAYLLISVSISALMNLYNRRVMRKGAG